MAEESNLHEYLVLSRGQWDASASKHDIETAIDGFYVWYERGLQGAVMGVRGQGEA